MNRKTFQVLANLRIREAQALLRAKEFSGAYYLVGYAVECGLKACIAKGVKKHDFYPGKRRSRGNAMAGKALVEVDLGKSEKIVAAPEEARIPVAVALWVVFPEYDDWRLVLASRSLDLLSLGDAYLRVNHILKDAGITVWETPTIFIMKTTDPFIRALRKVFGKAKSVAGMHLGGQAWGGRFVEDAYAYKIA